MCGIVGYIGFRNASEILVQGLEKLEYRGYDSAGIAVKSESEIVVCKEKGRLENLKESLIENPVLGNIGIGHTRWATHGEPSKTNSHPHTSEDGLTAVVHNGIIENFFELKEFLKDNGYHFNSETDTEVIPHLIDYYYEGDFFDALKKAVSKLKGSYALGVISQYEPDKLFAVRKDSPLIVGVGEGENFIASDIPAILSETRDVYFLEDGEFVVLKGNYVEITDINGKIVEKEIFKVDFSQSSAEKNGYKHFMLKEIHEQPKAIADTLRGRLDENLNVNFDGLDDEVIKNVTKIYIVACGTAYHAGLIGRHAIEKLTGIPVFVELASEFRYNSPLIDKNTLVIVISQSGETADTLAGLRLSKKQGSYVLAITNVVGSTVSREADFVFYTYAGPEISVASTKAYTTQLVSLYLLSVYMGEVRGTDNKKLDTVKRELLDLSQNIEKILLLEEQIKNVSKKIYNEKDVYYLGRGMDYAVAMEGSLKLKEISYIHSETYAGGELKHGPIALIEDNTIVVSVSTDKDLCEKMESNIKEVVTRGAYTVVLCNEDTKEIHKSAKEMIIMPFKTSFVSPVLSVIPLQLLAYHVAELKGNDIDKPKNLAKSVTVE